MESVKTAKVQIHPREKDAQLLFESMKAYARGCSFVSEYIFETEDLSQASRHKKVHTFVCTNCSYTSNDDRIGAMNLYRMGIEYLVESQGSMSSLSGAQSIAPDVTSA